MPSSDLEKLAEVPFAPEHHVAEDQKAPLVPKHLQREIDRATRAVFFVHFHDLLKIVVAE